MNGENRKEFREILVIAFLSLQVLVSITLIFRVRNLEQAFVSYTEAAVDESESESYDFVEGVVPGDGYSVGPDNAPITIVEFSDFQCPYCASSVAMWRAVLEKYPGQTRLIYRHFPLPSHSRATEAALAAECAGEQGYFWEMHDKLFANRDTLNELAFETLARELDLDDRRFSECMASQRYLEKIQQDQLAGQSYGVQGTPAFFINGYRFMGFNQEAVESLINELLLIGEQR